MLPNTNIFTDGEILEITHLQMWRLDAIIKKFIPAMQMIHAITKKVSIGTILSCKIV